MVVNNFSKMCRLCLAKSDIGMTPLQASFDQTEQTCSTIQLTIYEAINRLWQIHLEKMENLPQNICGKCYGLLKISYDLRTTYEKSQRILRMHSTTIFNSQTDSTNYGKGVELIVGENRYNLNDVVVVEEETSSDDEDYLGFLQNLGKNLTVEFPNDNDSIEEDIVMDIEKDSYDSQTFQYACGVCNTIFNNEENVNDHIATEHAIKPKLKVKCKCGQCGKVFATVELLRLHIRDDHREKRSTHNTDELSTICDVCQKKFINTETLHVHMKIHDSEQYKCEQCDKRFVHATALTTHLKSHYQILEKAGPPGFACQYCDKSFRVETHLRRHIRSHLDIAGREPNVSDPVVYNCLYCEKQFRSNGEKLLHELVHAGEKPYRCVYCSRNFMSVYVLKQHLMTHPGPFACTKCSFTFMESTFLKRHMLKVHQRSEDHNELSTTDEALCNAITKSIQNNNNPCPLDFSGIDSSKIAASILFNVRREDISPSFQMDIEPAVDEK